MSEIEKDEIILELQKRVAKLEGKEIDKSKAFSDVKIAYLESLVSIKKNFNTDIFKPWFTLDIDINNNDVAFLESLLNRFRQLISQFNEDTLKVKFIGSILLRVDFLNIDLEINDFYHKRLKFENDKINFNGYCDFYVAKGLDNPREPYFFIQEYKPSSGGSHPEAQLLAELISAVELNKECFIKGAYIIGATWNFVILEKLGKDKYQYFVSRDFNSTNLEDLKDIYKNLMFVKNEIIKKVKAEKNGV